MYTSPIWVYKDFLVLSLNDLSLKATTVGENIRLSATILADDFKQVELQKSFNGNSFTTISAYLQRLTQLSYLDNAPTYGHQFYRLKCTNKNGEISYSKIVSVNFVDDRIRVASLYPNPITSHATIVFTSKVEGNAVVKIYNAGGTKVEEFNQLLSKGNNKIVKQFQHLPAGRYFINIECGTAKTSASFIKQK